MFGTSVAVHELNFLQQNYGFEAEITLTDERSENLEVE
jgi:hypothetical protein